MNGEKKVWTEKRETNKTDGGEKEKNVKKKT